MGLCGTKPVQPKSRYKLNTLRRAVKLHEPYSVQEMINIFNRNKCFENGYSPLTLAIREGHDEIVEVLLEAGADPNKIDKFGQRPLHAAVKCQDENILKMLLRNGARTDLYDDLGWTPLQRACERSVPDLAKALLDAGANPNDGHHTSPAVVKAALSGSYECLDKLLQAGASANSYDFMGTSAINYAISSNNADCVRLLLQFGADPNSPNAERELPVRQAVLRGNVNAEILQALLAAGCQVNTSCEEEIPLLIGCVINGSSDCMRLLLTAGMNPDVTDRKGKSPLYHAAMMILDNDKERYYSNFYSHVYRMYSALDPGVVDKQEAVKCLELLLVFNSDVGVLWEHLASKMPSTPFLSQEQIFAYELCIKSYGFARFTSEHYKRVLALFLKNHAMNLVILLYKVGMDINDIFDATLEMKSGKIADEIFTWVQNVKRKPRSLLDLARLAIRHKLDRNVPSLVAELDLSDKIKEFLWLNDLEPV